MKAEACYKFKDNVYKIRLEVFLVGVLEGIRVLGYECIKGLRVMSEFMVDFDTQILRRDPMVFCYEISVF